MSDWRDQEATTQTIFREINEWTEEGNDARFGVGPRIDSYLCECSDRRCTESVQVTRLEYELIRAEPLRFLIALNHENPEIDRLVEENERFGTVDMFHGFPVRIARKTYPRR
ncbi:MAG TPA: hypothetical protein VF195_08850 [Actinomycetota bacterium]